MDCSSANRQSSSTSSSIWPAKPMRPSANCEATLSAACLGRLRKNSNSKLSPQRAVEKSECPISSSGEKWALICHLLLSNLEGEKKRCSRAYFNPCTYCSSRDLHYWCSVRKNFQNSAKDLEKGFEDLSRP